VLIAKCDDKLSTRSARGARSHWSTSPILIDLSEVMCRGEWRNHTACWAAACRLMSALPWHCAVMRVTPAVCTRGVSIRGSRAPPLPFLLEVGFPLNQLGVCGEHCKLPQQGPGWSSGRKQILCTLKLWESHWWQSFWVFWTYVHVLQLSLIRSTVMASVRHPKGGDGAGSAPSKSATVYGRTWTIEMRASFLSI